MRDVGAHSTFQEELRRVEVRGVLPLELWDLVVRGSIISEQMHSDEFPELLVEAVSALRRGTARARASPPAPLLECRNADFLFIGGGGALRPGLAGRLSAAGIPAFVSPEGPFAAERGGWQLLAPWGGKGMVIDLGQTSIKVSLPGLRWIAPRDFRSLPPSGGVRAKLVPRQRESLVSFIARSVRDALRLTPGFEPLAVVAALPSEVDAAGVPSSCSYRALEGDRAVLVEALGRAGIDGRPLLVLNDAEMAALAARATPEVPRRATVLVLTLGSGLGGALVRAAPGTPMTSVTG